MNNFGWSQMSRWPGCSKSNEDWTYNFFQIFFSDSDFSYDFTLFLNKGRNLLIAYFFKHSPFAAIYLAFVWYQYIPRSPFINHTPIAFINLYHDWFRYCIMIYYRFFVQNLSLLCFFIKSIFFKGSANFDLRVDGQS